MTFRHYNPGYQKLLFLLFAFLLPFAANSSTEEVIGEKRIKVAMRMIGHEVLLCLGDTESRVLPIEYIDGHYKIPFEFEFGFDPFDVVSIIDRVVKETSIASNYLVEIEQCDTKAIVHSFEVGNEVYDDLIACRGRAVPEDCYSLLITIMDDVNPIASILPSTFDHSSINGVGSLTASKTKESNLFKSASLIIPLLFLIGLIGFFIKKKNQLEVDPNLILIGASQFDQRNMALSFQNKSVELSNKEAELLSLLHTSANKPIEREVILQRVWGDEGDYVGRTLDVFISKLRKKLEADASVKIVNIRGVGYKLVMNIPK